MADNRGLAGAVNEIQESVETARIRNWAERKVMPTINTAEIEARIGKPNINEPHEQFKLRVTALELISALKAETARAETAEAALHETFVDDTGLAWSRPTAEAYYLVCRLRDRLQSQLTAANEKLAAARGHTEWLGEYLNGLLQDKAVKATFAREHAQVLHAKVNAILDAFNTRDGNGR